MKLSHFVNNQFQLSQKYFGTYSGIALFVFIFILFFQPFHNTQFEFENKLIYLAGFGVICLCCTFIVQLLFHSCLLADYDIVDSSKVFMPVYFFVQFALAGLAFIFYIRFVGQIPITYTIVVRVAFICMSLPVTMYLKRKLNFYKERIDKSDLLYRLAKEKLDHITQADKNQIIELLSENNSDNFSIKLCDIIYVKSADNYVEIGYYDEGLFKKKLIRNTLKNIELQLMEYNNFFRTHRTCIVNIQYIDKLNKNMNTYWLTLDHMKETIPVSHQYLMAVKDIL